MTALQDNTAGYLEAQRQKARVAALETWQADVVRLLALGAKGVLLGRAWAWALAAGGEAGSATAPERPR